MFGPTNGVGPMTDDQVQYHALMFLASYSQLGIPAPANNDEAFAVLVEYGIGAEVPVGSPGALFVDGLSYVLARTEEEWHAAIDAVDAKILGNKLDALGDFGDGPPEEWWDDLG